MRSIQVNIDRPNFTINPTNCSPILGRLPGDRRPGHRHRLLLLLPRGQLRGAPLQAEDDDAPGRQAQGDQALRRTRSCQFDLRTRPGDANIKSLSVTLPDCLRDRPAPPRQHLLRERAGRETVRRAAPRSARRRRRRRCSTSRSPARSTRSPARAACRSSPSSSTARSTWCRAPKPRRSPRRRRQLQTTVPVVPDAPIGHFRLTVFGGKTGYLVNTRDICASPSVTSGRLHRPERQDASTSESKVKTPCGNGGR